MDTSAVVTALAERRGDLTGVVSNLTPPSPRWAASRTLWPNRWPPAAVPSPGEHHVREPQGGPRRRGPAGRRGQAGGAPARPLPRRCPGLRPGRRAHRSGPLAYDPSPGSANDLIELLGTSRRWPAQRWTRGRSMAPAGAALSRRRTRRCAPPLPRSPRGAPTPPSWSGWFDDFSNTGAYDALGAPPAPGSTSRRSWTAPGRSCASSGAAPERTRSPRSSARTRSTASEASSLACYPSQRSVGG